MESKKFVLFKLYKDADGKYHEDDKDGREAVEFRVTRPNRQIDRQANIKYNQEFQKLMKDDSKFMLRLKVPQLIKDSGAWDDDAEKDYKRLQKQLSDKVLQFGRGGITKNEAYDKAIEIAKLRGKISEKDRLRNSLDGLTAESQCEEIRFNYYIYRCTTYNGNKEKGQVGGTLVFGHMSFEEFMDNEDMGVVVNAAGTKLLELMYQVMSDENKSPEWKFFEKYGYTDDKGRLLDKTKSHLVNLEGQRINEKGELVDDDGKPVDEFGNPKFDISEVEFLDE